MEETLGKGETMKRERLTRIGRIFVDGTLVDRAVEAAARDALALHKRGGVPVVVYAFLAQVLTFADADLEKLYVFARHLRRLLPADREELPREVQQNIDMESYRIQQTGSGRIAIERRAAVLAPVGTKD